MAGIRKNLDSVKRQQRELVELSNREKCKCIHRRKNSGGKWDFNLLVAPAGDGRKKFICRECEKELSFERIDQKSLEDAVKLVDRAIDTIKMSLNPDNEKDADLLKKLSKFQYKNTYQLPKLYETALKMKGKNDNNRRKDESSNSAWNKPRTI